VRGLRERIAALALAGLVLGACGAQATATTSGAGAPAHEVKIVAKDNAFDPAAYAVPAGQPIRVTFLNSGKNVHELEIKGLIAETQLQPGESKSFTVTPEKQSYELYCEIHEDQGMKGESVGQ